MTERGGVVTVEIKEKPYQVPEGVTALQALWHTGHELLRGIGCLGGVCGACTFTYKVQGEFGVKTGLACQVLVGEGMSFAPPVSVAQSRPQYLFQGVPQSTSQGSSNEGEGPQSGLFKVYPESRRCTRCNACTLVCPQEIDVRACVVKAVAGGFSEVSEMFYNCVMCGLCASVCDVSIQPNLVGLYARRMVGVHLTPRPENLLKRIQEVESGVYESAWQEVLQNPVSSG